MKEELKGKSNGQGEIIIVQKGFQMSIPSGIRQEIVKIIVNAKTPTSARFFTEIIGKKFKIYGSEKEFSGRFYIYIDDGNIYFVQKAMR